MEFSLSWLCSLHTSAVITLLSRMISVCHLKIQIYFLKSIKVRPSVGLVELLKGKVQNTGSRMTVFSSQKINHHTVVKYIFQ